MALKSLFVLVYAITALAQQPVWSQCGGIGWNGGTTCVSGTYCFQQNPYYFQCIPGSGPTTATTPTSTPTNTVTDTNTNTDTNTATATTPTTTPTSSAVCSSLPANINLVSNAKLPDPFKFLNGSRVTTKADWTCRQQELNQLFQRYETGTLPPKPSSVTASFSGNTLTINVSEAGKSISFSVSISRPSSGTAPFPAIIAYGFLSLPTPPGVAVITFTNEDIAAQAGSGSRGQGKFYTLYGSSATASAMTAWAWAVSRIIDALEITPAANINLARIAVTGCSRNGKGALLAGAFDSRIALTIPQESGSGGAGSWRISDAMKREGIDTQTAAQIVTENPWFSRAFESFVNQVPTLPFDHHLLSALIAPRGLLVIENTSINWLGPRSNWGAQKTANKVWQALGVPDAMGVSQVGNHEHCSFPSSQQSELDAFINKFLKGQATNTNVMRTDGANNVGFVESTWVDWTVPTLT